ncbi:hypothetical protein CKSOR_00644 [Candidatus Kinetoplastibacterium sorsogonicusi]|uniref:SAM-dependent methyltransferase n=1 Tax=Candidatus Kinetoplastidibacterium kentomonadis TaxID=1576550 RepID=A0A3Q8F414_9PROT|nr:SAM-dependent methyltransferase [Candidatus Kinetoplastibacterium sorsogonicusi]AWD32745.1 hypothetical protein CKSOR_00644 [Candidatus Kinetoplastibacterium sorsogonicusi]
MHYKNLNSNLEANLSYLSLLDEDAKLHIDKFSKYLQKYIKSKNYFISFEEWMDKVLYTPNLGYYDSKNLRIHNYLNDKNYLSDYITAPEIDNIFAQTLSIQIEQILQECKTFNILEIGAGNGSLAYEIIKFFQNKNILVRYFIIDISNSLIKQQKKLLNNFSNQIEWLINPPKDFVGCVIANELLDAMPISIFKSSNNNIMQLGVTLNNEEEFIWAEEKVNIKLSQKIQKRLSPINQYIYEINFRAENWIKNIVKWLRKGVVILIDYGFPRKEYYHPERLNGTLMCHIKHYAHTNPLIAPGEQDITAHIDFTAIAENAISTNLQIMGYTTQSHFLINSGILNILSKTDINDHKLYLKKTNAVKKFLSETDMGELFKVIAIGKDIELDLIGFANGNRKYSLF